ncbi:hypothetical protein TNIN_475571 [Trichonephila inaurata madagascariensis]|uniref:Uncharacterized protein n=1 Tax=Trichonephila inaurata madagascariensis TaxID=2747483 RepID=A0A8X6YMZ6_9ARAC|nr:hypothetical protein TNIN_475571 [Trichonephila inaurata madagascariensis]
MKPGALFLHIDNAGGGFHQLIEEVAKEYGLKREISRNYEHFEDATFNVRRFHYVACYETDISFHLWRKTHSKKVNNTLERKSPQVTINILPSSIQEQKYKYEEKAEIDSYNEINTPPLDQVNKRSSVNEHNPSGCSKTVIPAYDQINTSQLDQVNSQSSLNQYITHPVILKPLLKNHCMKLIEQITLLFMRKRLSKVEYFKSLCTYFMIIHEQKKHSVEVLFHNEIHRALLRVFR